jgi:hypothetical protein
MVKGTEVAEVAEDDLRRDCSSLAARVYNGSAGEFGGIGQIKCARGRPG